MFSKLAIALVALSVLGAGCSSTAKSSDEPPSGDTAVAAASDGPPEERLYEQLRSGSFQLNAAAGSIEESLTAAKSALNALPKSAAAREGMLNVVDYIDSAGSGIAEFAEEPPSKEDVAKDFSAFDDKRLKAVAAASDALRDLREALGVLETMADDVNPSVVKAVLGVKALVSVAIDDLWGAIEALGGSPEASGEPLDP